MNLADSDPLVPPDYLIAEHAGGFDRAQFIDGGEATIRVLVDAGRLKPWHRVLDIGCGCGRIARPLTRYLTRGGYDGLDVGAEVIDWCRKAYAIHPNFRFHHADVRSSRYNPAGTLAARDLRLPLRSRWFDFVFVGSVFTHMVPADAAQYLSEIARVMKPSGGCFASFYMLDAESAANNAVGATQPWFQYTWGSEGCSVQVLDIPEAAIAYPEALVRQLYAASRLAITKTNLGRWGRQPLAPQMQDIVWSRRITLGERLARRSRGH